MSVMICTECQFNNTLDAKVCRKCKFPFDGDWPSLVGQVIGNYELTRRVGGGGFGAVYHAKHVTLGNSFAVKILHPNLAKEGEFIERFQQEAFVLAELKHENVVQVIDFGSLEGVGFYLITEWLEGRNLYRIWRRHLQLDRGWLLALFSQLLDALEYAHERGIVHRDLKPENLMLTTGARNRMLLKIVDFGIAKIVEQGAKRFNDVDGGEKRSAMAVGTPYYMAPEQVQGLVEQIGPRTDLYACGIILSEMLTGQRVFEAEGHRNIMRLQLEAFPPTMSELQPNRPFTEELEQIVAKALSKLPEDRFQDAHEFYEALEKAMELMDIEPVWEDIYQTKGPSTKPPEREPRPEIVYKMVSTDDASASILPAIVLGFVFMIAMLVGGFLFLQKLQQPKIDKHLVRRVPARRVIAKGWNRFVIPPSRKSETSTEIVPAPSSRDGGDISNVMPDRRETTKPKTRTRKRPSRRRRRRRRRRTATKRRTIPVAKRRTAPVKRIQPPRKKVLFSLSLQTKPPGGTVYIGKKAVGKTPILIRSESGKVVKIRVHLDGKVDFKYTWRVKTNKRISYRLIEDL